MKKAEIQSRVFIYIIVAVVILLLLIFAFVAIQKSRESAREIAQRKLEQEIDSSLQEIEYGSVERQQLNVPPGTKEVCFTDITKRNQILTSPIIQADKYTMMRNIIQSGEKKNIFFFTEYEPYLTPIYQPGICFDHYPYFLCIEPRANILNLYIEGRGRCGLIVMEYKVCETVSFVGDNESIGITDYNENGEKGTQGVLASDVKFGSINAKLEIPSGTTLRVALPEKLSHEICIEAVSYIGTQGLLSEVYSITPNMTLVDGEATINVRYEDSLLHPDADPLKYIKLKVSRSPWETISNQDGVDIINKRVTGSTKELGLVAVFGPEPPIANITVKQGEIIRGEDVPEGHEAIVAKGDVIFDASLSSDPDGDILTYEWDFGDNTGGEGVNVTHTYIEQGSYNVTLTVTDSTGYTSTKTIILTIVNTANQKNIPDGTIIIISNPVDNWRNILQLVPAAMWKNLSGDQRIPYLVYHKDDTLFQNYEDFKLTGNAAALKETYYDRFYKDSVQLNEVTIMAYSDSSDLVEGVGSGIQIADLQENPTDDYFNYYWSGYEDIVVVDYNNKDAAVMASLFAAFLNAPIMFVDKDNNIYADTTVISSNNKIVHVVGNVDGDTNDFIRDIAKTVDGELQIKRYTLDGGPNNLRNPTINPYQKLYSQIGLTSS